MDIKRAKKEIKDSIEAYLAKDEFGDYMIPQIRQRPILLMGPPGIGKTQVMEQVAYYKRNAMVIYEGLKEAGYTVFGGINSHRYGKYTYLEFIVWSKSLESTGSSSPLRKLRKFII